MWFFESSVVVVILQYICHFPIEVLFVEISTVMTLGSRFFLNTELVQKFKISKWIIPPTKQPVSKVGRILQNVIGTSWQGFCR
jgi:hypothetical protein